MKYGNHLFGTIFCAVALLAPPLVTPTQAVTILSGPVFTPATSAPLAGLLQLTTDTAARVSVLVNDGTNTWERDFYTYTTSNSLPLFGFKPGRTNLIQITVYDEQRNAYTAPQPLTFITASLPATFPIYTVLTNVPDKLEPGYAFFTIRNNDANLAYIVIMDNFGNVVWYSKCPNLYDLDVEPLDDGTIFIPGEENVFTKISMLGLTLQTWYPPSGYPINPHDGFPTSHGTILYLSDATRTVANFPSSDTISNPPLSTVSYDDEPAVEISITNAALLNSWSPLSFIEPTRVTYLTYGSGSGSGYGVDDEHANAVLEDTNDNSLIISLRNQNAVCKITRDTKQLKWILGPPANWGASWQPLLLTPVGTPFDWNYGQHAPQLTPSGTLLVYDDNNYQASEFVTPLADQNNHSSAIEYQINETNLEVSEVWNSSWQTNQDQLFTPYVGMVDRLPATGNILVNYGAVSFVNGIGVSLTSTNAKMVRIIEYTHDPVPQVVLNLSFFNPTNTSSTYQGDFCYRAYHLADLYPHPAEPVTGIIASETNHLPLLQFSADPTHGYLLQTSSNLVDWTSLGMATVETNGNFSFVDTNAIPLPTRFYRVVTQ